MRAWRALKASGAAVLRDGVYLMPEREPCRNTLEAIAADVLSVGGTAFVLRVEESEGASFVGLFDRSEDYVALLADVVKVRAALTADTVPDALKQTRKLRKTFANLGGIDFFPGEAQRQADAALQELELAVARVLAPDEPHPVNATISRLSVSQYQGRTWATRRRLWVDRVASAWLIRRFIDREARLLWLDSPADCPADALGFDFDGAAFTHIGDRVTFEVLLASFGLDQDRGLQRLGAMVHALDVGGSFVPEASGFEAMMAGARQRAVDDDQLLAEIGMVLDSLYTHFSNDLQTNTDKT